MGHAGGHDEYVARRELLRHAAHWRRRTRFLAFEINTGWWLDCWRPWGLAVALGGAFLLLWTRRSDAAAVPAVWWGIGGAALAGGEAGHMIAHHQHNEHKTVEQIAERIAAGEQIALITDAGTPGIWGGDSAPKLRRALPKRIYLPFQLISG